MANAVGGGWPLGYYEKKAQSTTKTNVGELEKTQFTIEELYVYGGIALIVLLVLS